jgi:hypothetical protein
MAASLNGWRRDMRAQGTWVTAPSRAGVEIGDALLLLPDRRQFMVRSITPQIIAY